MIISCLGDNITDHTDMIVSRLCDTKQHTGEILSLRGDTKKLSNAKLTLKFAVNIDDLFVVFMVHT